MSDHEDRDVAMNLLAGIGIGAIIGAVTALMLAPKPGAETREDVKRTVDDLKHKSEELVSEWSTTMEDQLQRSKKLYDETKGKLQQVIDAGKKAVAERSEDMQQDTEQGKSEA